MTLTKRDLVNRISGEIKDEEERLEKERLEEEKQAKLKPARRKAERGHIGQQRVLEIVQKTLDYIAEALAAGGKVELRNFGVFEVKVRKARIGRNPNEPDKDVPIPQRSVVKFKAGKEMRKAVLRIPPPKASGKPTPI